jgi:hypothetical protein
MEILLMRPNENSVSEEEYSILGRRKGQGKKKQIVESEKSERGGKRKK